MSDILIENNHFRNIFANYYKIIYLVGDFWDKQLKNLIIKQNKFSDIESMDDSYWV